MIRTGPAKKGATTVDVLEEATRIQAGLRKELDLRNAVDVSGRLSAAGLDVSYEVGSERIAAAVAVVDTATVAVVESVVVLGEAAFPYVPGLLAFREVPILVEALGRLEVRPDVLVCDGYGIAHPRRFGLASHIGVVTGLPSFGVAKTPFTVGFDEPGEKRGSWSPLKDGTEVLGAALRTQDGVKPVFVSVGHRIGLAEAIDLTLRLSPRYRLPETTRAADSMSRRALRALP
jgi:deoxyribonuclease V